MFERYKASGKDSVEAQRRKEIAALEHQVKVEDLKTQATLRKVTRVKIRIGVDDGTGKVPDITRWILLIGLGWLTGSGKIIPLLQALLGGH